MAADRSQPGFLDRPAARGLAVAVAVVTAGILVWIHRAEILPGYASRKLSPEERAYAACYDQRARDIDDMKTNGTITAQQASLFKSRAQAMCRDEAGGNNKVPSPVR